MTKKRSLQPNKFIVKKSNSNNRSKPIFPIPLWLASLLNKAKRTNFFTKPKSFNFAKIIKSIFSKRKKLLTLTSGIFFASLILAGGIFLKVKYDQIEVFALSANEEKLANLYNNKTQNIIYINFTEGSDSNKFAKYISIISYNKINNNLKILAVEPKLVAYYKNKAYTLETLYNNINENSETRIQKFIETAEGILGVRIDGYIAVENQAYGTFIKNKGLSMVLTENYKVDNKFYKAGDSIFGEDLLKYLHITDSAEEVDSTLYRNNIFVTNMLQTNRNIFFSIFNFFDSQSFTNTFKTNLDKSSMLRLYNDLFFQSNLPIQSQYILLKDGYLIDTLAGKALVVNQIDIDNKVQEVFRDLDIVREQAKIEVLNASRESGLATFVKKIIQNSGGNVVNSGNYSTIEEEPVLYIIDSNINDYANTIALIQSLYPNVKIKENDYKYNKLGNLILVIGAKE